MPTFNRKAFNPKPSGYDLNMTLTAQLYQEFKTFFPEKAVEYFVLYYELSPFLLEPCRFLLM